MKFLSQVRHNYAPNFILLGLEEGGRDVRARLKIKVNEIKQFEHRYNYAPNSIGDRRGREGLKSWAENKS